jgi:hypothetical protein
MQEKVSKAKKLFELREKLEKQRLTSLKDLLEMMIKTDKDGKLASQYSKLLPLTKGALFSGLALQNNKPKFISNFRPMYWNLLEDIKKEQEKLKDTVDKAKEELKNSSEADKGKFTKKLQDAEKLLESAQNLNKNIEKLSTEEKTEALLRWWAENVEEKGKGQGQGQGQGKKNKKKGNKGQGQQRQGQRQGQNRRR